DAQSGAVGSDGDSPMTRTDSRLKQRPLAPLAGNDTMLVSMQGARCLGRARGQGTLPRMSRASPGWEQSSRKSGIDESLLLRPIESVVLLYYILFSLPKQRSRRKR